MSHDSRYVSVGWARSGLVPAEGLLGGVRRGRGLLLFLLPPLLAHQVHGQRLYNSMGCLDGSLLVLY